MKKLNVRSLHTALAETYPGSQYHGTVSDTNFTYLVSPSGLPLHVGWFDNSRKRLGAPSVHAIVTYSHRPSSARDRLLLEQPKDDPTATLRNVDDDLYLEGIDDWPSVTVHRKFEQPLLHTVTHSLVVGARVLRAAEGEELDHFAQYSGHNIPDIREFALTVTEREGAVVGALTGVVLGQMVEGYGVAYEPHIIAAN